MCIHTLFINLTYIYIHIHLYANIQNLPRIIVSLKVLTQEDWNLVLFLGMERTSHWAALYFVALMTFGNYVLFNLLVAILVEGFSNQVRNNFMTRKILPTSFFAMVAQMMKNIMLYDI